MQRKVVNAKDTNAIAQELSLPSRGIVVDKAIAKAAKRTAVPDKEKNFMISLECEKSCLEARALSLRCD